MRWKRLTKKQKQDRRLARWKRWTRCFALWPKWDVDSGTVYWLEFVWVRHRAKDKDDMRPWVTEYRGGNEAPEVKQCPSNMAPTVVPDAAAVRRAKKDRVMY